MAVGRDAFQICLRFLAMVFRAMYRLQLPPLSLRKMPLQTPLITPESLVNVRAFSASLPASVAQQLLRTWANGWTTSFRMHEIQLLNCFFGCFGQPDTQQHYLTCPCPLCCYQLRFGPVPGRSLFKPSLSRQLFCAFCRAFGCSIFDLSWC